MLDFKSLLLLPLLATLGFSGNVQAESIKVAITFPKGSAGDPLAKMLPTTTKITPCNDPIKIDAATFSVTYDAKQGATTILDVYVLFYNPDAAGTALSPKFYSVQRDILTNGVAVTPHAVATAVLLDGAAPAPYVAVSNNFTVSGSVTDLLFGSSIIVDSLPTGTWQLIGILADSNVKFDDPSTWAAWDVQSVVLGSPWNSSTIATCV